MNSLLIFILGSLSGCTLTCFCFSFFHSRKMQEARDEFSSLRETIRRRAYASGYETAKTGGLKSA